MLYTWSQRTYAARCARNSASGVGRTYIQVHTADLYTETTARRGCRELRRRQSATGGTVPCCGWSAPVWSKRSKQNMLIISHVTAAVKHACRPPGTQHIRHIRPPPPPVSVLPGSQAGVSLRAAKHPHNNTPVIRSSSSDSSAEAASSMLCAAAGQPNQLTAHQAGRQPSRSGSQSGGAQPGCFTSSWPHMRPSPSHTPSWPVLLQDRIAGQEKGQAASTVGLLSWGAPSVRTCL